MVAVHNHPMHFLLFDEFLCIHHINFLQKKTTIVWIAFDCIRLYLFLILLHICLYVCYVYSKRDLIFLKFFLLPLVWWNKGVYYETSAVW